MSKEQSHRIETMCESARDRVDDLLGFTFKI